MNRLGACKYVSTEQTKHMGLSRLNFGVLWPSRISFLPERHSPRNSSAISIAVPSVGCLLSVTLVFPTQRVEIFRNVFAPY